MLSKCLVLFNFKMYLFLCGCRLWGCASMEHSVSQMLSPSSFMGSKDQAQVVRLVWQMPWLVEPSAWALFCVKFSHLMFLYWSECVIGSGPHVAQSQRLPEHSLFPFLLSENCSNHIRIPPATLTWLWDPVALTTYTKDSAFTLRSVLTI